MEKSILIERKMVYGNELFYPACEQSRLFAVLANTKTLTKRDLGIIKELGYEIKLKQQEFTI